jgi:hypothetical protein
VVSAIFTPCGCLAAGEGRGYRSDLHAAIAQRLLGHLHQGGVHADRGARWADRASCIMRVHGLVAELRTLLGVSAPSRVVRSIMLSASFIPCTFVSFLMLRVLMRATRSSMPTWSMVGVVGARVGPWGVERIDAGDSRLLCAPIWIHPPFPSVSLHRSSPPADGHGTMNQRMAQPALLRGLRHGIPSRTYPDPDPHGTLA